MVKGDVNKPKGKTSAYAYFVQTYRDEHKRKSPDVPVNFSEFSKKCSVQWKVSDVTLMMMMMKVPSLTAALLSLQTLTASDKIKYEDMAKLDKGRYDREMKTYVPPKGTGKMSRKKKDPNAPKRPP